MFLDRRSLALDLDEAKKFPEARKLMRQETFPDPRREADLAERTQELSLSSTSKQSSSQTSSKVCTLCYMYMYIVLVCPYMYICVYG